MSEQASLPKLRRLLVPTADEWAGNVKDFVPLKTRDPELRTWLHGQRPGVRALFDEAKALRVFREMMTRATNPEEAAEVGKFGAVAMFGASGYLFKSRRKINNELQVKTVQNRYVTIPPLANIGQLTAFGAEQTRENGLVALDTAIAFAESRLQAHRQGENVDRFKKRTLATGRAVANTAVLFALIETSEFIANPSNSINAAEASFLKRDACTGAIQIGHQLGIETGFRASLLPMVDPLANQTVEMQIAASDALYHNYPLSLSNA